MKKIISMVLAVTFAISSMLCVSAADEGIKVYLEGNKINFDVQPQTINDRTMVPIRAIFEAMGANVTWDNTTQTAISTKDNTTVKMTLNSTTEYINDVAHEMDVTPVIIDGRTLAPARYVAEAFGYNVDWDDTTKSVLISKNIVAKNTYEGILAEYTVKLQNTTPILIEELKTEAIDNNNGLMGLANIHNEKLQKLAEISVEGTQKMAKIYLTSGSGNYSEYSEWAGKLQDVYQAEGLKLYNVYMELCK